MIALVSDKLKSLSVAVNNMIIRELYTRKILLETNSVEQYTDFLRDNNLRFHHVAIDGSYIVIPFDY